MIERHTEDNIADRPQFFGRVRPSSPVRRRSLQSTSDDGRPALHSSW